jgi:ABC-type transport system involved in cytochrome c biogenesis permease component
MLFEKYAAAAAASCGLLMTLLTLTLYVPQWIMARSVLQQVTAINFVFDTLLFAGTVLMVSHAIAAAAIVTRAARADGAIELASYASA